MPHVALRERLTLNRLRLAYAAAAGFAVALGLLGAAAAQPQLASKDGGTLVVGVASGDADSLDPTTSRSAMSGEIYRTICMRLYEYDTGATMRLLPLLAAAMPVFSKDKLSYTVELRHGVEFNDGTPFNADAVVASARRFMTYPLYATEYTLVDSVTASGPYTVVYHLKERESIFSAAMGNSFVLSPTELAKPDSNFGTHPVCVGPFMFEERVVGDHVTVVKSPYYWDRKHVYVDRIVYKPLLDAAAAAAALKAGDIDVLDSVSTTELPAVQRSSNVRVLRRSTPSWWGIYINIANSNGAGKPPHTNAGTPLSRSAKLRQAFAEAIDRDALARVVFSGLVVPSCTMISPSNTDWFDATKVPCTPFDPKHARALVATSGFPNPTVHLLTRGATDNLRAATFIQIQEAAVGIHVVIDVADTAAEGDRATTGNFDTRLNGWAPGSLDPHKNTFQFLATTGGRNYSGYSNPRMDLILNNAAKATSFEARSALYRAAQRILLTDRPVICLYSLIVFTGVSARVTGVELYGNGLISLEKAQFK